MTSSVFTGCYSLPEVNRSVRKQWRALFSIYRLSFHSAHRAGPAAKQSGNSQKAQCFTLCVQPLISLLICVSLKGNLAIRSCILFLGAVAPKPKANKNYRRHFSITETGGRLHLLTLSLSVNHVFSRWCSRLTI